MRSRAPLCGGPDRLDRLPGSRLQQSETSRFSAEPLPLVSMRGCLLFPGSGVRFGLQSTYRWMLWRLGHKGGRSGIRLTNPKDQSSKVKKLFYMRYLKVMGLCLVAAFALGAVARQCVARRKDPQFYFQMAVALNRTSRPSLVGETRCESRRGNTNDRMCFC